jgi:predicted Zn finger-like uncharacterized protein
MIVICEECGKKYKIDPSKIKGRAAGFKCRTCSHLIVVSKPASAPIQPQPVAGSEPASEAIPTEVGGGTAVGAPDGEKIKPAAGNTDAWKRRKAGGFGLRVKMLLLFLFLPMILVAGASLLYLWQLETVPDLLVRESTNIVNRLAEEGIAGTATSTAMQCKLYLASHPDLIREDFNEDMGFKTLAVQKVGTKGYTALYELPGADGIWRTWAHINAEIIGVDMNTLQKTLGKNFSAFWKVYSAVKGGKMSQGYYTWQDTDGKFRDKFMVCVPIAGTRFVIAATTYVDEFTEPVKLMQSRAKTLTDRARLITWTILGATLLLIGLSVYIYSHRLTGNLKSLTEAAERISVGESGVDIEIKSKDEIGELAEAIAKVQESIRLSAERLQRQR